MTDDLLKLDFEKQLLSFFCQLVALEKMRCSVDYIFVLKCSSVTKIKQVTVEGNKET